MQRGGYKTPQRYMVTQLSRQSSGLKIRVSLVRSQLSPPNMHTGQDGYGAVGKTVLSWFDSSCVLHLKYGRVCKWLKQADCKSVPLRVRGFESHPSHQIRPLGQMVKTLGFQSSSVRFNSGRGHHINQYDVIGSMTVSKTVRLGSSPSTGATINHK